VEETRFSFKRSSSRQSTQNGTSDENPSALSIESGEDSRAEVEPEPEDSALRDRDAENPKKEISKTYRHTAP